MPSETPEAYFDKFAKMGGIVEEFIEAEEKLSPSAQLRNSPRGEVMAISTHDQILGGPERPGLPRLPLPRPRRLPAADPGGGHRRSAASSPPTAW